MEGFLPSYHLLQRGPIIAPLLATLEFSDGGVRFALFIAVMMPAVILASKKSSFLVDYYIVVVCLNRFVRRLLDWSGGIYDERPISSLLPLAIGVLMMLVVIARQHKFPRKLQYSLKLLGGALAYAMLVGLGNGLAAIFTLLEYIAPFALLYYGAALRIDLKTLDRWITTMTTAAIFVAAYGWYQWVFVPPWDLAWINWSGMWSSMGLPIPYEMGVCSTLESRGPYAWFLAGAAIPPLLIPRLRKRIGMAGALFIVASMLPSTVRSGWGILIVGVVGFGIIRGGRNKSQMILSFAAVIGMMLVLKTQLPESEKLFSRVESMADIGNDRSFQGRVNIAQHGFQLIINQPQGYGLGSSGMAGKVSGEMGVIGDNGLLELLSTFGLPGMAMLATGFGMVGREVIRIHRYTRSPHAALGLAQLVSGIAALTLANWLAGLYSGMSLMTLGGVLGAHLGARTFPYAAPRQIGTPPPVPYENNS